MSAALRREHLVAFVFLGRFPMLGVRLPADFADLERRKNYSAKETIRLSGRTGEVFWVETACPKLLIRCAAIAAKFAEVTLLVPCPTATPDCDNDRRRPATIVTSRSHKNTAILMPSP